MASTREERMQQRLRGAQRRQVKDVDFGLTFAPIPALTQPPDVPTPIRKSPRRSLELAPQLSTRPTPGNRARSQPPIATPSDENVRPATNPNAVDANTSAKRRKLDTDEPSTSQRSTRSSFPVPRRDIYALSMEGEPEALATDITNGSIEQSTDFQQVDEPDTSALFVPQTSYRTPSLEIGEVEITESPSHAPGSGHRTRTLIGSAVQSSQLHDELQIDSSAQIELPRSPTPQRKRKRHTSIPDTGRSRRIRASTANVLMELNTSGDEVDELSPEQSRRGRRHRSSIQKESFKEPDVEESVDDRETAEEVEDEEAATILKKNRGHRQPRHAPAEPSSYLGEPSEQVVVGKKQRSRPHPASSPAQRYPKNANPKAASKPSKKAAKKRVRMNSPIPVTVHRLTERPTYDEEESDADILNADIPYARRGGVNTIDVLSQVCQEVIGSSLDTIHEHSRNAQEITSRREFRDKQRFVEAFGRELQTRLLEHTINLDNTLSLERRVREEQKKKLALREEILRVRAQREQVALRMDEIRVRHEMESKDALERDTLNTAVHNIELAVECGKEKNSHEPAHGLVEMVGVELLLKRIAGEVSNKSDSGGMLKQIRDFNAFLERVALALESRKV